MRSLTLALVVMTGAYWPAWLKAEIYSCKHDHQTLFSDSPCGEHSASITVSPTHIGGRLDTGTDVQFWQPPSHTNHAPRQSQCSEGYIQSTDLRRLRVRRQVREGMNTKQVQYVLGDPDHHDGQWWVYQHQGKETGRYLIRGGCLRRWR